MLVRSRPGTCRQIVTVVHNRQQIILISTIKDVCKIAFEFLNAFTAIGSCVFLQEVEPKLFAALAQKVEDMEAKLHRLHFVPHGTKVWPVDKCPWSWLRPRGWSGSTEHNVGNMIIMRIPAGSGPSATLEDELLLDGDPEGNRASVIRWGEWTYLSAHVCTVISPIRHIPHFDHYFLGLIPCLNLND